ncbi:MAG: arabinofuranosyltransferase, partial [Frankiaceae bacterium]|nr:arabinofuranosyltransferase [Frankiaceae bacterium]
MWVAVPALTVLVLGYRHRFMSDDGLIVTRSVREILAGNGPVLSPGLRVETSTSTAWQWLLAVAAWLTHIDAAALAVYGGLLLTTAGVALAVRGTQRLHRMEPSSSDAPLLLPAGVLILLGLRPVWDFATSGLETGLETFWIGTAWWILNAGEPTTRRRGLFFAFVLGAGPLVRPDLAVVAGIFLVVRWVRRTPPRRILAAQLGAAAVLPVGYEIFRMGYYGLLVPTTAVAKESGATFWERGRLYLLDFVVPFRLWLVLPVALALVALVVVRRRREGRDLTVVAAPVAAAAVATIFVVRVGGDWMQARMLLPPLLLLLLPVLVVPVERRHRLDRAIAVGAVAVAVWAALLGSGLLPAGAQNPIVGTELRRNIQALTGRAHPLTGRDFTNVPPGYPAAVDRYSGRPVLLVFSPLFGDDRLYPTPVRTGRAGPVFVAGYLGAAGAAVPVDDTLIDQLSLGYPVGAHLQLQR